MQCVVLYSAHMFNQERGALWILISHFVISRYLGGEVCALECEASVCLKVTGASAGDLHFSISGEKQWDVTLQNMINGA